MTRNEDPGRNYNDAHCSCAGPDEGGDQAHAANHFLAVPVLVDTILAHHRRREWAKKQRIRLENALSAFIRINHLGFAPEMTEDERERLKGQAKAVIRRIRRGKPRPEEAEFTGMVSAVDAGCGPFLAIEADMAKVMAAAVRGLPVWPWAAEVKGLGPTGLAMLIGEAGDLARYDNPAKLWTRLGVGMRGERRQGGWAKGASDEEKAEHHYKPGRRSISWQIADSLFKSQWRGEKDGVAAHPIGPYGEIYAAKKADYLARVEAGETCALGRDWTRPRADACARRYMEKRLLRDLWRAWRETMRRVSPTAGLSPAADPEDR